MPTLTKNIAGILAGDIVRQGSTATVSRRPNCDLCGDPAAVDAKTRMGPWANMCKDCFLEVGIGLGTGLGQVLIVKGGCSMNLLFTWCVNVTANEFWLYTTRSLNARHGNCAYGFDLWDDEADDHCSAPGQTSADAWPVMGGH